VRRERGLSGHSSLKTNELTSEPAGQRAQLATKATNKPYPVI